MIRVSIRQMEWRVWLQSLVQEQSCVGTENQNQKVEGKKARRRKREKGTEGRGKSKVSSFGLVRNPLTRTS